jgi:prolyl oligopeptidase
MEALDQQIELGGLRFTDPYRHLEENNAENVAWQKEQDAAAVAHLQRLPQYAQAQALLARNYVDTYTQFSSLTAGRRWFHLRIPEGRTAPVIELSDTLEGPRRLLIDCAGHEVPASFLPEMLPSPDGRYLLYSLQDTTYVTSYARVVEVESGHEVLRSKDIAMLCTAWLPDSSGLLYVEVSVSPGADGKPVVAQVLCEQRLNPPQKVPQALPAQLPILRVQVSADGRYAAVYSPLPALRPVFVRELAGDAGWRCFPLPVEGGARGAFFGDDFAAVLYDRSPHGRLVAIPVASSEDASTWRELLPPGTSTLAGVRDVGDRLAVVDFVDGHARLRVLDRAGHIETLALPEQGAIGKWGQGHILSFVDDLLFSGDDAISFMHSSLLQSPTSFVWSARTRRLRQAAPAQARLEGARYETRTARRADGGTVTYHQVCLPRPVAGARPTIVTGYGGYAVPSLAPWSPLAAAWVRAGGVWVHAHLRGGREFGMEFQAQGRLANKQGTFDDLYAVAEDLVARGVTTSRRMGMIGTSNGGYLAGMAVAQRPELFGAVIPQVPVLDLFGVVRDPRSLGAVVEDYGNPQDPQQAPRLMKISPYHALREGTTYPAVFVDASELDPVCPPWHSRKFAARLRQCTSSDRPVLLRVRENHAHNVMSPQQQQQREIEILTFFASELGLDLGD